MVTLSTTVRIGRRGGVSRFSAVLADAEFPLRRWEILTIADGYGLDSGTRSKLEQIPDRAYADSSEVMIALANTPAHLATRRQL